MQNGLHSPRLDDVQCKHRGSHEVNLFSSDEPKLSRTLEYLELTVSCSLCALLTLLTVRVPSVCAVASS